MTDYILAHPSPYDVSITLAIFDNREQVTQRIFTLRNLKGQTESEQIEEATTLMAQVASELHYITRYGIDKGTVKLNGKKAHEVVYRVYTPHIQARYFRYGVNIGFSSVYRYQWVNDRHRGFRIAKDRLSEGWQREITKQIKTVSFRLPCMAGYRTNEHFFRYQDVRKRGRKAIGWLCYYDHEDNIFNRFINRFFAEGNLAIGEKRYWSEADYRYVSVKGIEWPPPPIKKDKVRRRSKIASRPKDETDYVYLIRMGRTKYYKIGKSNDPLGRLASMQTASPYKLKLLHTFKADNAAAAEEALHHQLHEARMEGEWFKLTDGQQKVLASVTVYEDGWFVMGEMRQGIEDLFSG